MEPYFFMSRWWMSSSSRDGETAATALASSLRETVPEELPGSQMAWKMYWCSSSSCTPTVESSAPSCRRLRRPGVSLLRSSWLSTSRIEDQPSAIHLRRRSSMVRTGVAASTAVWNSRMEMAPFLSESRKSKTWSMSSRLRPTKCLFRKRPNSFRESSLLRLPLVFAKWSNAFFMVQNLSSILCRNCMSRRMAALRFLPTSVFLLPSGVALPIAEPEAAELAASGMPALWRLREAVLCTSRGTMESLSESSRSSPPPWEGLRGKIRSRTLAVRSSSGSSAVDRRSDVQSLLVASTRPWSGRPRPSLWLKKKWPLPDGRVCRPLSLQMRRMPPVDCQ
mmetsp:Transcript_89665/g.278733  ORF Transcript_89665/g.278733 Transcript_89665/m.278733 type:complete len:336 (+) Transcript_89665:1015-2022(+)